MNTRVMLVDDHAMFREALHVMLDAEPNIDVVGELPDGQKIEEATARWAPDVIVMDVSMPNVNGPQATRRLLAARPGTKVVALSGFNYRQFMSDMLDAGASAYVVKSAAGSQLVQAIESAMNGKMYLCPESTALLLKGTSVHQPKGFALKSLSKRETAVLRLIADGKTSREIGLELHIATSTVDVHRRNIMAKLELHNVVELTKYAINSGLLAM